MSSSLIGSIVERKPSASTSAPSSNVTSKTGFPLVQHRSKSAFSRARNDSKKTSGSGRPQQVPVVVPVARPKREISVEAHEEERSEDGSEDWRRQVEEENKRQVERMTEEEREEERREILERFGPGIGDILRKARAAREAAQGQKGASDRPFSDRKPLRSAMASRPTSPDLSASSTRPPSRSDKRIRFAQVTPQDVYVYESAPPSPRKKPLALPPPSDEDGPTISLGEWKSRGKEILLGAAAAEQNRENGDEVEEETKKAETNTPVVEGTPEDIRRRFFPQSAPHLPSLEWIEGSSTEPEIATSSSTLRFDLTGSPIPPALTEKLPTHLGLHHHAEGTHAGYTLDDIFLLSRSTVPAQRASMLSILGKIARKLSNNVKKQPDGIVELQGQEADLRKRILAAGVEAMGERGSLGASAVEVTWICLVAWDEELLNVDGVELKGASGEVFTSFPLDYILQRTAEVFGAADLPPESLLQLLGIVRRFAQESNEIADNIVSVPTLVSNLFARFVLTPIPSGDASIYPEPLALQTLNSLAQASRANAVVIGQYADTLLRFVVTLPPSSPYPEALASTLLSLTLDLYRTLASYGLRCHLSATASEPILRVGLYVLSDECTSTYLRRSWLGLLEAWMTCARDPHRTTPGHDILWSQVIGWNWGDDILELRRHLTEKDIETWAALWRAEAAWLEGSSVNGIRAGEVEKTSAISAMRKDFEGGTEKLVVNNVVERLSELLGKLSLTTFDFDPWQHLAQLAGTLSAVIRLWLACLPPPLTGPPASPPFVLPFSAISILCARLTTHPLWTTAREAHIPGYASAFLRPASRLLGAYLDLSRVLPGSTEELWMAQAVCILTRLLPGDEELSVRIIESVAALINPVFMERRGWSVPPVIWEKKGTEPIVPFLTYALRHNEVYIGPLWMTPASIAGATTQRLPATLPGTRSEGKLPLPRDWTFTPLDHLLRSGQSEVFKSLPSSWDASETDIVRATLLLAKVQREVLRLHGLVSFALSREETVFACMKVFMLEHEQQQVTSSEEVFRDGLVGQLMDDLVAPFTIAASTEAPAAAATSPTLDIVAKGFLGPSTPFYQYYTDFVALYDSISFSHPLFARLLLPPLSMRYPSDYRKYLWADYGHVLRTVKTPIESVIAQGVEEFLWPVETNPEVLAAYLRALVKGQVEGFLRLVAVHHIACNVWPDLRESTPEETAIKLLQAVAGQGDFDAVKDVVFYHQSRETTILPHACFSQDGEWKVSRREFIGRCGPEVKARLEKLLQ